VDQSGEYLIVSQAFDPWVLESYAIDADSGDLTSVFGTDDIGGFPPGGMVMHPSRSVVYLTDTVDDTLEAYSIASDGTITALGSEAAINDDGSSAVALAVAPDGDHVYVVDRGYQEVMGFNTGSTGALGSKFTTQDLADDPRVVAIHPDGAFLYVTEYDVDTLWIFEINSSTGSLTSVSGSPFEISDGPGVMTFSPDGSLLFMGMVETGEIKVFSVDTDEGTLTEIEGSPFASGVTPIALQVVEP
jgi:6-phosphogluconolactonase (cycloisomerase 2 family)